MNTLNTNRRFGVVRGSKSGAAYEQDGKFFDAQKREIDLDGNLVKAATPPKAPGQKPQTALLGSNTHDSTYEIGGETVPLGDLVAAAYEKSGLSVEDWNSQDGETLDSLIEAELQERLAAVEEPAKDDTETDAGGSETTQTADNGDESQKPAEEKPAAEAKPATKTAAKGKGKAGSAAKKATGSTAPAGVKSMRQTAAEEGQE